LENTSAILFIPDLVNYFLTGEKFNEYTIASTSQLYNPVCNSWSTMIFKKLGLPEEAMQEIVFPGTVIGGLLKGIRDECDIHSDLAVMSVGSHDTASAVAATPLLDENSVFLSSGTWSLLGMELDRPLINLNSLKENFTNEMGVGRRVRFLKNITGLWLIQECKRIWEREGKGLSYSDISKAANQAEAFKYRLDPDDPVFLNPENMPRTIRDYCQENNQTPPETIGEVARGIYESLAFSYKDVIEKIEKLLNKSVQNIHMVGGGIKAEILCQYTANISGRSVFAGPVEATAMGNIITQLIGSSEINSLEEGRTLVRNSIELKEYLPGSN
ncbi:MAG: rhamnulokinase, partial [Halanaerobiales bacterium]